MASDIIFRLSRKGGPPPEAEILFHAQRAQEYGVTWVGLGYAPARKKIVFHESRLYLISSTAISRKTVLRGIIRDARSAKPSDPAVNDFYAGHDFDWWWEIGDVECATVDFNGLELVGESNGLPYDVAWLSKRQNRNYLLPKCAWPADASISTDSATAEEGTPVDDNIAAPALLEPIDGPPAPTAATEVAPGTVIHAVDWSGGGESAAANPKIRYASWTFTNEGSRVSIEPPTLSRAAIVKMITSRPGLWILDFPFGLPVELLRRGGAPCTNLAETHAFTRAIPKEDFRTRCMAFWNAGPAGTSKFRETEIAVGSGWFDWFMQLFRQTWSGQVEVLCSLLDAKVPVAILPWDHDKAYATQVVEGFPRASLRHRGLPASGYKSVTAGSRKVRRIIIDGLVAQGLPLDATIRREAEEDPNGDLIDALILLLAGRDALSRDHAALTSRLRAGGRLAEGWIYV